MLGLLINEKEYLEVRYLLVKEMDEILFDLEDERINPVVKRAMEERYQILFVLFKRFSPQNEWKNYSLSMMRKNTKKR